MSNIHDSMIQFTLDLFYR